MDYSRLATLNEQEKIELFLRCFGALIEDYRNRENYSVAYLHDISGIHRSTLARIRNGEIALHLNTFLKLCFTLDITGSELLRPLDFLQLALWPNYYTEMAISSASKTDMDCFPNLKAQLEEELNRIKP